MSETGILIAPVTSGGCPIVTPSIGVCIDAIADLYGFNDTILITFIVKMCMMAEKVHLLTDCSQREAEGHKQSCWPRRESCGPIPPW